MLNQEPVQAPSKYRVFYTYVYYDPILAEAIYVGKGCSNRAYRHLRRDDNHPLTNRLKQMKSRGILPRIEVIDTENEEQAFYLEMLFIQLYGRKDRDEGSLLNLTDGGEGSSGFKPSVKLKELHRQNALRTSSIVQNRPEEKLKRSAITKSIMTPEMRKQISDKLKATIRLKRGVY